MLLDQPERLLDRFASENEIRETPTQKPVSKVTKTAYNDSQLASRQKRK